MTKAEPNITVADIVEVGSWRLEVLAGTTGLENRVEWAHVFDIEDPSAWLDGRELVFMTSAAWPASPSRQVELIEHLAENNASALGLGARCSPPTSAALKRADAIGLPVIRVPMPTRYLTIVYMVAAANADGLQKNLASTLRVFESLKSAAGEISTSELFDQLQRITGYDLCIVTSAGISLFEGMPDADDEVMSHVRRTYVDDQRWTSLAIPGGFASAIMAGSRVAGFVAARERDPKAAVALSVFGAVETVARIEVGTLYRRRESVRHHRAQILSRYLFANTPVGWHAAEEPVDEHGAPHPTEYVMLALRTRHDAQTNSELDDDIAHRLADRSIWNLLVEEVDRIIIVTAPAEVETIGEILSDLPIDAGVSNSFASLEKSPLALRQATWALEYGEPFGMSGMMRSYSKGNASWVQWLPSDPATLVQLVKQTIGPLLDYDAKRKADLVASLRVYFEEDCKLQVSADRLFVHKHTLAYRLKRIEQLTGRDLDSVRERSSLWLAMSALAVVSTFPGEQRYIRE